MATEQTVKDVVKRLFLSPLVNKPKPLPGKTEREMIEELVNIYFATLQDIPDDLLMVATVQYLTTEKWFPSIADLRAAAVGLLNRANDVPDPSTAWGQIKIAARSASYHVVAYDDENGELAFRERGGVDIHPLALRAINVLGGIKEFALAPLDNEGQWRKRFVDAYQTFLNRQREDAMMLPQIANYIEKRRELNGQSMAGLIEETAEKLSANGRPALREIER